MGIISIINFGIKLKDRKLKNRLLEEKIKQQELETKIKELQHLQQLELRQEHINREICRTNDYLRKLNKKGGK